MWCFKPLEPQNEQIIEETLSMTHIDDSQKQECGDQLPLGVARWNFNADMTACERYG